MIRNPRFYIILATCFVAAIAIGTINAHEIRGLKTTLNNVQETASSSEEMALRASQEVSDKRIIVQNSQEQILTSTVAKAAPAVVSVVISKNIPQFELTYGDIFGDGPLFKNFDPKIPIYRSKGSKLQKIGSGSGFLISHDGHILTNRHVVSDNEAEYSVTLANGEKKNAKVVYRDPNYDVAVIKIDGSYPSVLTLGDSSNIKLAQTVVAIGDALGEYPNSVSVGSISGLNRTIQAVDDRGNVEELSGVIQTDAAINLGNSGGPLIDLNGEVVGINVATVYGSNNINFSIPINTIKGAIGDYSKK